MSEAHQAALREIEDNRERLGAFNITLFGRTMTGKSTLMEILTEGDGHTISKGAQRTTRDTRQIVRIRYEPNGEYGFNGERIPDNQRSDCTYQSVRGNHPTLGSFYPCPVPGGALRHQSRTGATEYIRVHREVYRDLIGQLGTKNKQIARKDTQLDNTIQRNGELNVLLQGYQKRLGALPPPTDIREHVTPAKRKKNPPPTPCNDAGDYRQ